MQTNACQLVNWSHGHTSGHVISVTHFKVFHCKLMLVWVLMVLNSCIIPENRSKSCNINTVSLLSLSPKMSKRYLFALTVHHSLPSVHLSSKYLSICSSYNTVTKVFIDLADSKGRVYYLTEKILENERIHRGQKFQQNFNWFCCVMFSAECCLFVRCWSSLIY